MLYRHWSLYQAMYHSSYLATRLGVWRERGEDKLKEMFGRMGLSLTDAQQQFNVMNATSKEQFHQKIREVGAEFKLTDLTYGSFLRHYEFNTPVSAADVVYAITALLEFAHMDGRNTASLLAAAGDSVSARSSAEVLRSARPANMAGSSGAGAAATTSATAGVGGAGRLAGDHSVSGGGSVSGDTGDGSSNSNSGLGGLTVEEDILQQNFFVAYQALSDPALLQRGIALAKLLQQAIVRVGKQVILRKQITRTQWFHYVILDSAPDLEMFNHPLALNKLALFLVEALQETRPNAPPALAVLTLVESRQVYLVVGVMGRTSGTRKKLCYFDFPPAHVRCGRCVDRSVHVFVVFVV